MEDTKQVLLETKALLLKCQRVFTIILPTTFPKMLARIEDSNHNVSWLLHISAHNRGHKYTGVPSIKFTGNFERFLVWELIAILHNGSLDARSDAAVRLLALVLDSELLESMPGERVVRWRHLIQSGSVNKDSYYFRELIVEEGGVKPLLKLLKDGNVQDQENVVEAIGILGLQAKSAEPMIEAGMCIEFAKILKEGPMKVQIIVAWAVSELATHYTKWPYLFA